MDFHVRTKIRTALVAVLSSGSRAAAWLIVSNVVAPWYDLRHFAIGEPSPSSCPLDAGCRAGRKTTVSPRRSAGTSLRPSGAPAEAAGRGQRSAWHRRRCV